MSSSQAAIQSDDENAPAPPPGPGAGVPERIGKYYVVAEVGRGSTGAVYLSHDPFYGRDVAIKLYHASGSDDTDNRNARRMFLSEAHMVGRLQHPNIVPIYDAGEEAGRRYVVTEHVHGARTLSAYCRLGALLPIADVVGIVYKCAKALHYAHSRGVIHRDIKPSNVLLTQDGDVRIVDFGIALVAGADISRIEGVAGSPAYMSPEQVQGRELTPASDLYSLGAVMYELLAGQRPFRAGALGKLLRQIVYGSPRPLHTLRAEIPEEIEAIVARALQKNPACRPRNGGEFAAELTRIHQRLRAGQNRVDEQERFDQLRRLRFFHDFSHAEIREVMRAACWQEFADGETILPGRQTDDRFHVLVAGCVEVARSGGPPGRIDVGGCFGEAAFADGDRQTARVAAVGPVTVLRIAATLLEQVSIACQLKFHKVFMRELIGRLQRGEPRAE